MQQVVEERSSLLAASPAPGASRRGGPMPACMPSRFRSAPRCRTAGPAAELLRALNATLPQRRRRCARSAPFANGHRCAARGPRAALRVRLGVDGAARSPFRSRERMGARTPGGFAAIAASGRIGCRAPTISGRSRPWANRSRTTRCRISEARWSRDRRWPTGVRDRGRPLPASHGADAGGDDGRHRARAARGAKTWTVLLAAASTPAPAPGAGIGTALRGGGVSRGDLSRRSGDMVRHRIEALLLAFALSACHRAADAGAQQPATVPRRRRRACRRSRSGAGTAPRSIPRAGRRSWPRSSGSSRRWCRSASCSRRPSRHHGTCSPGQDEESPEAFGTGFIIRPDGIIITNQHVVANAQQITVTLADGTDLPAGCSARTRSPTSPWSRSSAPTCRWSPIGRSSDLMIGEWAIALGNPYVYLLGNSEPTVTAGVISATGRNILPTGNNTGLVSRHDPDRCRDQSRQFRRTARQRRWARWSASTRRSSRAPASRVGLGLRDPDRARDAGGERDHPDRHGAAGVGRARASPAGAIRAWRGGNGLVGRRRWRPGARRAAPASRRRRARSRPTGRRCGTSSTGTAVKLDLRRGRLGGADRAGSGPERPGAARRRRSADGRRRQKVRILKDLDLITLTPAIRCGAVDPRRWRGALVYQIPDALSAEHRPRSRAT